MDYTAQQIADMAGHIRSCEICCPDDDPDIVADTYSEGLPPEELADYIRSAHEYAARSFPQHRLGAS